jgi:Putative  PD-(D/E)XK family member, (DUF4420)
MGRESCPPTLGLDPPPYRIGRHLFRCGNNSSGGFSLPYARACARMAAKLDAYPTQAAVAAWRRDPDERYDFAVGNLRVEAKTSSRTARIHFLSAEQADPPPGVVGLLASSFVEQAGGGSSLEQFLNLIETKRSGHAGVMRLRSIVADTLGRDLPAALSWSFDLESALSSMALFDLRAIPAIRGPFPPGVSGVRFTVGVRTLGLQRL